jgi:enoyl-CoA hydratase/carnithine racemase
MTEHRCIELTYPAEGVAQVTLRRPQVANALSPELFGELAAALHGIEADDAIGCWILTGAPRLDGRPWFSAGADLKEFAGQSASAVDPAGIIDDIDESPKPSIAAIDGLCTTGALELALACDIRIAAHTAQFCDWHLSRLGSGIGAWGAATRLARLVGTSKAKELLLTGESIDGAEAVAIGLANRVVGSADLLDSAVSMAATIAGKRSEGVRLTMEFLNQQSALSKHEALRLADRISSIMRIDRRFDDMMDRVYERKDD